MTIGINQTDWDRLTSQFSPSMISYQYHIDNSVSPMNDNQLATRNLSNYTPGTPGVPSYTPSSYTPTSGFGWGAVAGAGIAGILGMFNQLFGNLGKQGLQDDSQSFELKMFLLSSLLSNNNNDNSNLLLIMLLMNMNSGINPLQPDSSPLQPDTSPLNPFNPGLQSGDIYPFTPKFYIPGDEPKTFLA